MNGCFLEQEPVSQVNFPKTQPALQSIDFTLYTIAMSWLFRISVINSMKFWKVNFIAIVYSQLTMQRNCFGKYSPVTPAVVRFFSGKKKLLFAFFREKKIDLWPPLLHSCSTKKRCFFSKFSYKSAHDCIHCVQGLYIHEIPEFFIFTRSCSTRKRWIFSSFLLSESLRYTWGGYD